MVGSINGLGWTQVVWSDYAVVMVPRSERKWLRALPLLSLGRFKPAPRIRGAVRPPSPSHRVRLRGTRRCAPRLAPKPAALRFGGRWIIHPALRGEFERHFISVSSF